MRNPRNQTVLQYGGTDEILLRRGKTLHKPPTATTSTPPELHVIIALAMDSLIRSTDSYMHVSL
jgi:hypothetical protein